MPSYATSRANAAMRESAWTAGSHRGTNRCNAKSGMDTTPPGASYALIGNSRSAHSGTSLHRHVRRPRS